MPRVAGLWYEWHGSDDGPVLILSAGLGGAGAYWKPNLDALSARYRVVTYDQRGTGRSDRTLPETESVERMADDVLGLMDGLGIERAHFLGHAAGAAIGLVLALRAPERLGGLILVNGWSRPDPHFLRCFDVRLALLRAHGARAWLHAQPIFLFPAAWSSAHSERLDSELAAHEADFQGVANLEKRVAALIQFDVDARLGEIEVPVLALASADDILVPAPCSQRLAERIPGAKLAVMDVGGHACNVTEPEEFNRIVLGWLAGLDASKE
jgi:aminoacrylate hydrolase